MWKKPGSGLSFPEMRSLLEDSAQRGKPQIVLGPHLGNFDLFGTMMVKLGLKVVALSYPKPNKTYQAQNALREQSGMRVMPINLSAFREAKKLMLHEGYSLVMVSTGRLKARTIRSTSRRFLAGQPTFPPIMCAWRRKLAQSCALPAGLHARTACSITTAPRLSRLRNMKT